MFRFKLIFAIFAVAVCAFANDGGTADGGGDFEFARVQEIFDGAKQDMYYRADLRSEIFAELLLPLQIDMAELKEIFANSEPNIKAPDRFRIDDLGYRNRLMMDYVVDANGKKKVEALLPFFEKAQAFLDRAKPNTFDAYLRPEALRAEFRRKLLHEALHHWGIGVESKNPNNNDSVARKFSMAAFHLELGPQGQKDACVRALKLAPQAKCIRTWDPEYEGMKNKFINWQIGRKDKGQLILMSSSGLGININLEQKEDAIAYAPPLPGQLNSECSRWDSQNWSCEPISREQNGKKYSLARPDRTPIQFFIREPEVKDAYLTSPPQPLMVARAEDTTSSNVSKFVTVFVYIPKENAK